MLESTEEYLCDLTDEEMPGVGNCNIDCVDDYNLCTSGSISVNEEHKDFNATQNYYDGA